MNNSVIFAIQHVCLVMFVHDCTPSEIVSLCWRKIWFLWKRTIAFYIWIWT